MKTIVLIMVALLITACANPAGGFFNPNAVSVHYCKEQGVMFSCSWQQ